VRASCACRRPPRGWRRSGPTLGMGPYMGVWLIPTYTPTYYHTEFGLSWSNPAGVGRVKKLWGFSGGGWVMPQKDASSRVTMPNLVVQGKPYGRVFFSFKYHFSFSYSFGGIFVLVLTCTYVNVVRLMT